MTSNVGSYYLMYHPTITVLLIYICLCIYLGWIPNMCSHNHTQAVYRRVNDAGGSHKNEWVMSCIRSAINRDSPYSVTPHRTLPT